MSKQDNYGMTAKMRDNENLDSGATCTECKEFKVWKDFYTDKNSKTGYTVKCKVCRYTNHRKKQIEYSYNNYHNNKKYWADWYTENRDKILKNTIAYNNMKYQTDIQFRIKTRLRSRINYVLKYQKYDTIVEFLGCTVLELRAYIESKFTDGMSWDTYGVGGWNIDHILACKYFNLVEDLPRKICFNWRNLQPLWGKDNYSKSCNLPNNYKELYTNIKTNVLLENSNLQDKLEYNVVYFGCKLGDAL